VIKFFKTVIVKCADTASAVETALATGHAVLAGSFLARSQLLKGELVAPFDTAVAPSAVKHWPPFAKPDRNLPDEGRLLP